MDADVAEAKRRLVEVIRAVESGEEIVRGASDGWESNLTDERDMRVWFGCGG